LDGFSELAKMLKERDNKLYSGPQVGKVVTSPPNIKVSLGDSIFLEKEDLVIGSSVLVNLVDGDEVILFPSGAHQIYYLIDKAVRL